MYVTFQNALITIMAQTVQVNLCAQGIKRQVVPRRTARVHVMQDGGVMTAVKTWTNALIILAYVGPTRNATTH